jgi:hypothetical protein
MTLILIQLTQFVRYDKIKATKNIKYDPGFLILRVEAHKLT